MTNPCYFGLFHALSLVLFEIIVHHISFRKVSYICRQGPNAKGVLKGNLIILLSRGDPE